MPYGVTLFIDKESEEAIRKIWSEISGLGISSFMIDNDVRPHITLAVYEELDVDAFLENFAGFANELSPISFSLSSIGTFLKPRGTVFLAPVVTHRLMNIHSRFHEYFHELEHSLSEYSLPGRWFPHFTLAGSIEEDTVSRVIDIGLKASLPEQSRIEEIGIGEFEYKKDSPSYFVSWLYSFSL
jgi:2'-5' RNA ligase